LSSPPKLTRDRRQLGEVRKPPLLLKREGGHGNWGEKERFHLCKKILRFSHQKGKKSRNHALGGGRRGL